MWLCRRLLGVPELLYTMVLVRTDIENCFASDLIIIIWALSGYGDGRLDLLATTT
ncbi:hypothetical protein DSUL_20447 [Desulfovibrionales bacterium]